LIGGFGFATGDALKLAGLATSWETNWHSVLEQTYGFINGIGLAVAFVLLGKIAPKIPDELPIRKWTDVFAAGFVLIVIPYLNLSKNAEVWIKAKAVPAILYGRSADWWFDLAFLALALVFLAIALIHRKRPLAILSAGWQARGQLLYLAFLWCVVIGNFERALVSFVPVRLITEGVIFLNACLSTIGIFFTVPAPERSPVAPTPSMTHLFRKILLLGACGLVFSILANWAFVRLLYGDHPARQAARHIRFGPNATATKEKPAPGTPHP
jgi:hypothetical protein